MSLSVVERYFEIMHALEIDALDDLLADGVTFAEFFDPLVFVQALGATVSRPQ